MAVAKQRSKIVPIVAAVIGLLVGSLLTRIRGPKPLNVSLATECATQSFTRSPVEPTIPDINAKKPLDLIIFGATGFTGSLVAQYLSTHPTSKKWALAGRSQSKLDDLAQSLNLDPSVQLLVADVNDPTSLQALMAKTKAVVTTVGPYAQYGEPLLAAAAQAGVHYTDLSGEFFWQSRMLVKYEDIAIQSGSKIVLSSGFDSLPFDLGVHRAVTEFMKRNNGLPPNEVIAVVDRERGWMSGGTLASGTGIWTEIREGKETKERLDDPYLMLPSNTNCRKDTEVSGWSQYNLPRYDKDLNVTAFPHFMAPINARIVRRSLELNGIHGCSYGEGFSLEAAFDAMRFIASQIFGGHMSFGDLLPKQGSGPPPSVLSDGQCSIRVFAKRTQEAIDDGAEGIQTTPSLIKVDFIGDPGYNATSKMIAEAGLCLADEACHSRLGGGFLTTSSAMGDNLIRRLESVDGSQFMSFSSESL